MDRLEQHAHRLDAGRFITCNTWGGGLTTPLPLGIISNTIGATMTGRDIERIRGKLGLTQQEFAQALGVALSTVSAWEQRRSKPGRLTQRLIGQLCRKRGVKV